jgi:hypothetical protein
MSFLAKRRQHTCVQQGSVFRYLRLAVAARTNPPNPGQISVRAASATTWAGNTRQLGDPPERSLRYVWRDCVRHDKRGLERASLGDATTSVSAM